MSSGGYSNMDRGDGPPRNVLSEETVRNALEKASRSASSNSGHKSSSHSSAPKPGMRRSGTGSSTKSQGNCDCLDCRDTSARETYGTERIDRKTGDRIREHNGDGDLPLHLHGVRESEMNGRPSPPRRSSTASSNSNRSRGSDKNISVTRDREGNEVKSWNGSEAPRVRAHYDWDAPENQINFPDAPRRTNTSGSSRHA